MKDDWSCGCSLLGGHICGKQKSDKETWGQPAAESGPSKDELDAVKTTPRIGDEVVCVKQFSGAKGAFDGRVGRLVNIDKSRNEAGGQWAVRFSEGAAVRWCYEIRIKK